MHRLFSFVGACVVVAASACTTFDSGTPADDAGAEGDGSALPPPRDGGTGSCGPANCPGCCFADACQLGTTAAACGRGGGLCAVCRQNQICKAEGQTCGVDPESNWMVQPLSAEVAEKKNGASDWDINGSPPDPYARLGCPAGGVVKDGAFMPDTTKPVWANPSCVLKARELLTSGIVIGVRDDDIGTNEIIAPDTPVKPTESELLVGEKIVSIAPNLSNLKIAFTRQP